MLFGADAAGTIGSSALSVGSLNPYPGDDPPEHLATEWMKDTMPKLLKAGYGPTIRNVTPPHLLMYEDQDPVPYRATVKSGCTIA